jgi:hypothetical protein
MHGTEHRVQEHRASRRSAPPGPISLPWDQSFPARRGVPPQRSRPLVTAFPSPATAAPSQRLPFRGQSSRPATSRPASLFPRPVRPSAPLLPPVCPAASNLVASGPLRLYTPTRVAAPSVSAPLRGFSSLGIKAFYRFRRHSARLPNPPDFLSLPATGSISRVGYGSPFLVRYVSGDWLFLKPLGTFFTMPSTPSTVNTFL